MTLPIIAIDPGPTESAWVLWDGKAVRNFAKEKNDDLLNRLGMSRNTTAACVIEKIANLGMPAVGESVFETAYWTGRFAQQYGDHVIRVPRHTIKMHLCGSMRAKDPNIRQALIDRIGERGTKKSPGPLYGVSGDAFAALAVAVWYWDTAAL